VAAARDATTAARAAAAGAARTGARRRGGGGGGGGTRARPGGGAAGRRRRSAMTDDIESRVWNLLLLHVACAGLPVRLSAAAAAAGRSPTVVLGASSSMEHVVLADDDKLRLGRGCTPQSMGAKADGHIIDTQAINAAISHCSVVTFSAAKYLTGTIRLRNHTRIVLMRGATVLAAPMGHYDLPASPPEAALACVEAGAPYNPECQDYGHGRWADALVTGVNLINVTIIGAGTFDGQHHLRTSCSASEARLRPGCKLLALQSVRQLEVGGVSFRNGGHFTFLLTNVRQAHLHDLDIAAARDGIDLMGVRHVLAERLNIHGGGDDAFKLGSDWSLGRQLDSFNITLRDSILASGEDGSGLGCQCIQFGSETSGNFDDIAFSNITCNNAGKAGIGITSMDGANITNLKFDDIAMRGTTEPIHMYVGARAWARRPRPFVVGSISNVFFKNIIARRVEGKPPSFAFDTNFTTTIDGQGVSQNATVPHPIHEVHFHNVSIHYEGGGVAADATNPAIAMPNHNPNDGGPRSSGKRCSAGHTHCRELGVRPSYGLFLRELRDSSFEHIVLSFEHNDDRPAIVLTDCVNISFAGELQIARGNKCTYDVGKRNSTEIAIASPAVHACDYPRCPSAAHQQRTNDQLRSHSVNELQRNGGT
jgi:hypothetical protein